MTSARAHRSALLLFVCLLAITACRTATAPAPGETTSTNPSVSTIPPFKTKEPERYSATRTITVVEPNGDTTITRNLIARDGPKRREEQQTGIVYLDLSEGRFVLSPDDKTYSAVTTDEAANLSTEEAVEKSPDRLLHTDPISTTYQLIGTETIAGRNVTKFRVVVNDPGTETVKPSETLIWIDSALNMPIKGEMKSPDGVVIVNELSDITLQPDKQLFQIPAGYEKIPFSALQKQLKTRGLNP